MSGLTTVLTGQPRGAPGQAEGSAHDNLRNTIPVNSDWRFKRQSAPGGAVEAEFVGAEKAGYDDSSWDNVWVPHTWDSTPDNPFATAGHFRGIGWYRRSLDAPESWRGRRVWINFKAVFQIADVWVNGHHVGGHVGGYTGFALDITDFLRLGDSNLVAVKANDVLSPFIAPSNESNVAVYGGIYRTVSLTVLDSLHVRENGTWVTPEQSGKGAVIRIRTWVRNSSSASQTARLESIVLDADGRRQVTLEAVEIIAPGEEKLFDQKSDVIANPHLWSPSLPYLYRLVSLIHSDNRPVDEYATFFGFRFMSHNPEKGFLLNGVPINLHGVDRRQDYGFLGDALPEAVGIRDVLLMKEMGVNFIRTSHYPQDPAVIEACSRLGILVWEEIPNIKIHVYPPPVDGYEPVYSTRFPRPLMDNLKYQLKEMIERDRNHPSIIMWGFGRRS